MTRYLRELLTAAEPAFSQAIREFEDATGNHGVDISLSTDIEQRARTTLKFLGLDTSDTTVRETFHALQALARKHDEFLSIATGRPNLASPSEAAMVVGEVLYKSGINREAWVVKTSVMRRLLKATPPRAVMKRLGYRSIDSMIKRENVAELLLGARLLESSAWMTRLIKSYKKLRSSDFETRLIQIIALERDRWAEATQAFRARKQLSIIHSKELGVLGVMPMEHAAPGSTLFTYLQTIHYVNEIHSYSSFFKLKQVENGFGELVARTIQHDPAEAAQVLGRPIHWKSIKRHVARSGSTHQIFQPHLSDNDLSWSTAEDCLYRLEPALKFWQGLEAVGLVSEAGPVSFNLMDNVVSLVNNAEFGQQVIGHMQAALGNELLSRYLTHKQLEDNVLQQLEPAGSDLAIATFFEEGEF